MHGRVLRQISRRGNHPHGTSWREPMHVMVQSYGDHLHRRTDCYCKCVDDCIAPALARLSGALHGSQQKPTAAAFLETLRRNSCDLVRRGAWKKATLTPYLTTSLLCRPGESVRDEAADRISLEHSIRGEDGLADSLPRTRIDLRGHESRPHSQRWVSVHQFESMLRGFGQRDDCASAKPLDVVQFPLPSLLHF